MKSKTFNSIVNALEELDALHKLMLAGEYSFEEVGDFVDEIRWNLSNVLRGVEYNSDELRCLFQNLHKLEYELVAGAEGFSCSCCGGWTSDKSAQTCEGCTDVTCIRCTILDDDSNTYLCKDCFFGDE